MIVYIAGKITGDPGYKAKFAKAETDLKAIGYEVINPAVLPEFLDWDDAMQICLKLLSEADCICLLEDWYISSGARMEMHAALEAGKKIMTLKYEPKLAEMEQAEADGWHIELEEDV